MAEKDKTPKAETPVYVGCTALDNIRHNGTDYQMGDSINDMTAEQAQRLIAVGVLVLAVELKTEPPTE